jgi:uncharacterized membrane protein
MENGYIHLILNHLPVIGTLFLIIFFLYGLIKRNEQVNNFALVGFIMVAILTIPVFLSGEGAEEAVEHLQGVSHDLIEEHEEAGEFALWAMQGLNLLAIASLVLNMKGHRFSGFFKTITLVVSFFVLLLMINTGLSGGKIRRPELTKSTASEKRKTETREIHDND